jgi:hypothetical protein
MARDGYRYQRLTALSWRLRSPAGLSAVKATAYLKPGRRPGEEQTRHARERGRAGRLGLRRWVPRIPLRRNNGRSLAAVTVAAVLSGCSILPVAGAGLERVLGAGEFAAEVGGLVQAADQAVGQHAGVGVRSASGLDDGGEQPVVDRASHCSFTVREWLKQPVLGGG